MDPLIRKFLMTIKARRSCVFLIRDDGLFHVVHVLCGGPTSASSYVTGGSAAIA